MWHRYASCGIPPEKGTALSKNCGIKATASALQRGIRSETLEMWQISTIMVAIGIVELG